MNIDPQALTISIVSEFVDGDGSVIQMCLLPEVDRQEYQPDRNFDDPDRQAQIDHLSASHEIHSVFPSLFSKLDNEISSLLEELAIERAIARDGEKSIQLLQQQIAERDRAEQQLRECIESQAAQIQELTVTSELLRQRNHELDAFAMVASHDLRAPLRGIANLAQWLAEDLETCLTPETHQQFELLQARVRRMDALVEDLLGYARLGTDRGSKQVVDVGELLVDIIDALGLPSEFTFKIAPKMPIFATDRVALQQVLCNLIANAAKHHHRLDGKVEINARQEENHYLFEISDDGPGIKAQDRERIFEAFQTLQPKHDSTNTGMGLAIVKRTIGLQGGQIWIDANVGGGSKFSFTWTA